MSRAESIEALAGMILLAAGLTYYLGWPNVAIGTGSLFLIGAVVPTWRRNRDSRQSD